MNIKFYQWFCILSDEQTVDIFVNNKFEGTFLVKTFKCICKMLKTPVDQLYFWNYKIVNMTGMHKTLQLFLEEDK